MSNDPASRRLQPGDGSEDSTQRGCTTWLLISCVVLTLTTAFVFGWGLGAPNMYNQYTEPFLKGNDPCVAEEIARSNQSATTLAPRISDNQNIVDNANNEISQNREIDEGLVDGDSKKPEIKITEPFNFVYELIKGIPQTVFLIGAFIGAVTGPFWANLFDRKRTVFANYIFCFASSLCVLLASYLNQPWLFYLSRLLLGYQGKECFFFFLEEINCLFRWHGMCHCTTIYW
jgi:MFS family permease